MINYYRLINWKKKKENNSERTFKSAGLKKTPRVSKTYSELEKKPTTCQNALTLTLTFIVKFRFCFNYVLFSSHYYSLPFRKKRLKKGKERLTKIILSALFSEHFLWLSFYRRNCFESFGDYFLYFHDRTELKKLASYSLIFKNLLG